ncbi:SipW-dependent-type signal peptide-containing protein [Methanococcoides sp.]|jgi:predicted ribosomally synthesized peptide with SipW-like signal peptide|uniref:SipW-dependent-type signal peptide-containing protein n=1 Tax=Methanococcoides sp. TaxID=1966350 RepID=UPI00272E2C5B|nr:SipW-dependent-type signal peptide-containing protein [Methanococcoides sp.]
MKTIFTAILSIALISLLAGAGTFASFSDVEVSSGNAYYGDHGPNRFVAFHDGEWYQYGANHYGK